MSNFTSIKIKINENDHLGVLLAEYGRDFEIKIWILDKSDAWTGELSSVEAQDFISHYKITKEIFLEELQRALTRSNPDVLYSIDKNEDKRYVFSWKKCLDSGIIIKNGEMTLVKMSRKDIYDEVIERSFEHNSQLQSRVDTLEKEQEDLLREKEDVLSCLEKVVNEKENFEKNIYSQFLTILNAKKERIAELQESIDSLLSSQARESSKETIQSSVKRAAVKQDSPKPDRLRRNIQEKKKESKTEEEIDPFEVDTDVEEGEDTSNDSTSRPRKRDSSDTLSQSFQLDSFDSVSSPVAVLPKRSKLKPKEEMKRNLKPSPEKRSEKMESGEDLLDQF